MTILILLAFLLVAGSCSTDSHIRGNPAFPVSDQSDQTKDSEPRKLVKEFMTLVSEGKSEAAKALLRPPRLIEGDTDPSNIKIGIEVPARLDWVQVFQERDIHLAEIVSEKTEGAKSTVRGELGRKGDPGYRQAILFYLEKIDNKWLINDLDWGLDTEPATTEPYVPTKVN